MSLPHLDPYDRRTLDTAIWVLLMALWAFLGGASHSLYHWRPTARWTHIVGDLLVRVVAGLAVGFLLVRWLETQPFVLFAIIVVGSWAGAEILDRLTRWLEHYLVREMDKH